MRTLIRNSELLLASRRVDVLLDGPLVAGVWPSDAGLPDHPKPDEVVDAAGGALLPGLHDHHLHVMAMAGAAQSVDCGPGAVFGPGQLQAALAAAPERGEGWIRGFGYHESVAGPLDRHRLDALVASRPVRVQHRSGALWMLNSVALERIGALPAGTDVERGPDGVPTGRLWRLDSWLAERLPPEGSPDLGDVGRRLRGHGITGATDATPFLRATSISLLAEAVASRDLPPLLMLCAGEVPSGSGLSRGPLKLLLHDHDLPDFDTLAGQVEESHRGGRAVAVHVVTRTSLVLTLAVLEACGVLPGDRIEHAAVVPTDLVPWLARLGVAVVTQPGFLWERGDDYLRDVDPDDQGLLYPHRSLLEAGVKVGVSSDAPYGPLNPWEVVAAAADRRSVSGRKVGADRPVAVREALMGYLAPATDPGGAIRSIARGSPADVVLLKVPWRELARAGPRPVRRVWQGLPRQ